MGTADTKPGDPGCGGSGQLVEANDLQGVCLCSHGEAALFSRFQSTPTLNCEVFFINVRLAESQILRREQGGKLREIVPIGEFYAIFFANF